MILKNIEQDISNYAKYLPPDTVALKNPFLRDDQFPKSGDFFIADSINCKWKRDNLKYRCKRNTDNK
jgi:hypothetical protein